MEYRPLGPLTTSFKRLRDTGVIDAIIEGKPLEQRRRKDLLSPPEPWEPWEGSVTILFDTNTWEVRVRRTPRDWWIGWCERHGRQATVFNKPPDRECDCCEIVHVTEDLK